MIGLWLNVDGALEAKLAKVLNILEKKVEGYISNYPDAWTASSKTDG